MAAENSDALDRSCAELWKIIGTVLVRCMSSLPVWNFFVLLSQVQLKYGPFLVNPQIIRQQRGLLQEYVQSLLGEGIINDQFASVQTLKSADEPDAIIKLITSYFVDVEAVLSELTRSIDSSEADFDQLAAQANTIKEKSLCIGAEHMKLACENLIRACEEKQGRKFSQALDWMKLEFAQTQDKLDAVVQMQMEKRILRLGSKGPK
ncbi:uncharacterized protein LOC115734336 [Rhodamnia argentea]|uniref:Histidine-containing phosphotransfer protein n=1 Tax=Rhodamnia argentea TaxID=178133 RepID=A0ABM3HJC5_9MYRT|nr:uncharacterized protein LOC115734336 [Rhodamnia argentea]